MQNTGSYLDTSFCEQLTVGCKLVASAADLMESTGASWEFSSAQLICDFVSLEDKERRAVQAANYSMTKPLTMLTTSYFREASKTFTGERTFMLQCMHRCLNLTSVSSSDGRISQSVSI